MGVETEKKYRLTPEQVERVRARLREAGATKRGAEFEENTLYKGPGLDPQRNVLRLRRAGGRATLAYKERDPMPAAIKRHLEEETRVEDADALARFSKLSATCPRSFMRSGARRGRRAMRKLLLTNCRSAGF